MPRLFVAIDLPDAHKDHLADLKEDTLSARWTPPHQYHLTLRFIGDVADERVDVIEQSLTTIRQEAFMLYGKGLGVFPSIRKPRVLFAVIEPVPALKAFQQRIEQALQDAGVPADDKPFHPHVTLARLRGTTARTMRGFLKAHRDYALDPFDVTRYYLYESVLRPEGALHTRRATFELPTPA